MICALFYKIIWMSSCELVGSEWQFETLTLHLKCLQNIPPFFNIEKQSQTKIFHHPISKCWVKLVAFWLYYPDLVKNLKSQWRFAIEVVPYLSLKDW